MSNKTFRFTRILLVVLLLSSATRTLAVEETEESLPFMFNIFTDVLSHVKEHYIEEEEPVDLVKQAIEGMISTLDPFSDFLTPEESEEWQIRTQGEFGGLGIQIGIRSNWLTVIAPIEGTPAFRAGIHAGDRIVKIEDETTEGIRVEEAVQKLRGEPGTLVNIAIQRPGLDEELPFEITRDIIVLKAVPYYTLLKDDVGYLRLVSFSKKSSGEASDALDSLFAMGAKKLILDLRSNPGGLLQEAIKVSNLFLPKGKVVVMTRGRESGSDRSFRAQSDTDYGEDFPMVVMVNGGSASASEIVSGAIQDWDRGLVIGDTTFGKGSVQRIFRLKKDYELKLTTAKYYTPSGRCIHRDAENGEDTLAVSYRTKRLNREVKGGGGIVPDQVIVPENLHELVSIAMARGIVFEFAVNAGMDTPDGPDDVQVDDAMLEEFKAYMTEKEVEFEDPDFEEAREQLRHYLEIQLAERFFGVDGRYRKTLSNDPVLEGALDYLRAADSTDELFAQAGF
jgi:carboxyl-terminal processing protease